MTEAVGAEIDAPGGAVGAPGDPEAPVLDGFDAQVGESNASAGTAADAPTDTDADAVSQTTDGAGSDDTASS
ncbi:MAG: hypothetical protein WKF73_20955 [Nocardioidaceae bacterium]